MTAKMRALELCSGAGGMALGLARAGFSGLGIEHAPSAVAIARAAGLNTVEGDASRPESYVPAEGSFDLLAGGVPCQDFSTAGAKAGAMGDRNGFPWVWKVVDRLRERAQGGTWLFLENVPGLTHHRKAASCDAGAGPRPLDCPRCYLDEVILPMLRARFAWVEWRILDAADFGVPQRRKRVIILGGPRAVEWPAPTHSQAALVWAKWRSGAYWQEHGIATVGEPSKEEARLLKRLDAGETSGLALRRWRTVRDALGLGGRVVRESGQAAAREPRATDEPSHTMRVQHHGGGCGVSIEGRGALPQWARPLRPDEPSDSIQAVGEGPRPPCVESPLDEPHPTLSGSSTTGRPNGVSMMSANAGVRAKLQAAYASEALRVVGGGTNPHTPGAAGERSHRDLTDEPSTCTCIAAEQAGNAGPWRVSYPRGAGRAASEPELLDEPSAVVTTTEEKGTRASAASNFDFHGGPDRASDTAFLATGLRRLSVEECAALQGFPADWPFAAARTKTDQYRAVGNALPPAVAEAVGRAIRKAAEQLP